MNTAKSYYFPFSNFDMHCPNCNNKVNPEMKFCPNCGQEQEDRASNMKDFIKHFLGDYFTFDSKIFNSLVPLLIRPGYLTSEFIIGRRIRYIPPIRLYIFISILFFLIIRIFAPENPNATSDEWDKYFGVYLPRLFFVLLPIFAFFLWMLFNKKKWSFVVHFVFSLHFHAFLFLTGSMYLIVSEIFEKLDLFILNQIMAVLFFVAWLIYLFLSLKRVYQLTTAKTTMRFILLLVLYSTLMILSSILTLLLFS